LALNPRCSVIVDMDDRPLMGMRSNLAKAVQIIGDAEMAQPGQSIMIESGPWRGEYASEQAVGLATSRYLVLARDGGLGTTGESFLKMITADDAKESGLVKDNAGRVFVKIRPKNIRAWDFSKAPVRWGS
jgi:hypothetical protein